MFAKKDIKKSQDAANYLEKKNVFSNKVNRPRRHHNLLNGRNRQ